ncbi:MAG: 50S ribosomal protein L11 methyltransferase [Syntrophomonadaceae bacterium]|nr:50S ribosomal protein L11 methyltransferase [Syntrophomonadaceae bacterium]
MEWSEIRVSTDEPCAEFVAGLFHEWGAGGVIIEDPAAIRSFIAQGVWDAHCFDEEYLKLNNMVIRAFFPSPYTISQAQMDNLQEITSRKCKVDILTVRDEDWADNWKASYHSTRVGSHLVVKPSWEDCSVRDGDIVIELDPGMAFGTGTHITTGQALEFLEQVMTGGEKVLDVGTGSGILAIAATKLGAKIVKAVDIDPVAIKVARGNIKVNGVDQVITLEQRDLADLTGTEADLITANLTAPVIELLIDNLIGLVRPEGLIIAAGIGREQWPDLRGVMEKKGLIVEKSATKEDWVAVVAKRS